MIRRYLTELKATVLWYVEPLKNVPRLLLDMFDVALRIVGILLLIVILPTIPVIALGSICFDMHYEARKSRAKDGE